jgi:hypothetical protein
MYHSSWIQKKLGLVNLGFVWISKPKDMGQPCHQHGGYETLMMVVKV